MTPRWTRALPIAALIVAMLILQLAWQVARGQETEDRSWHLLQKQYDGLIRSVQHGLTRHECDFAVARIMGRPATEEEKAAERRLSEKQQARYKAEKEKWLADHPKCTGGQEDWRKDAPKECMQSLWGNSAVFSSSRMIMTDISSAECFQ